MPCCQFVLSFLNIEVVFSCLQHNLPSLLKQGWHFPIIFLSPAFDLLTTFILLSMASLPSISLRLNYICMKCQVCRRRNPLCFGQFARFSNYCLLFYLMTGELGRAWVSYAHIYSQEDSNPSGMIRKSLTILLRHVGAIE